MMSDSRRAFLTAAAIAAAVYFFLVYHPDKGVGEGTVAPQFALQDRSGEVVRLSDYRGRYVLVHFWATWCSTCVVEMPQLNEMVTRLSGNPNLVVLGLSLDETGKGNGWKAVEAFEKTTPVKMRVLMDSRGAVADQYGTYALPETYLVDPQGTVVRKFIGDQAWASPPMTAYLESELSKITK